VYGSVPNRAESEGVPVVYNRRRAWHDGLSCGETERSAVYHPPTARMQNHRPPTDSFIIYWCCWPWECDEHAIWNRIPIYSWMEGIMGIIMGIALLVYVAW